jgi:dUTP pyrophosphatase
MIVAPYSRVQWTETDALPETARGAGGFGSTGVAAR